MSSGEDSSEQALASTMTDLMTSLAVIFILLLVVYLNHTYQEVQKSSANRIQNIKAALDKELKSYELSCEYDANKDPLSCIIRVKDESLQFAQNKDILNSLGKQFMQGFTPRLTKVICNKEIFKDVESVFIQGFTNSDGPDDRNIELSQGRALAVLKESLKNTASDQRKQECLLQLVSTNGRGERELVSLPDNNQEDKAASRRVEFKIRVKSYEQQKKLQQTDLVSQTAESRP